MEWRTAGEEVAIATLTRRCRAPRLTRSPRANTTAPVSQRRPSSPFGQSPNLGKTDAAKRRRVGAGRLPTHLDPKPPRTQRFPQRGLRAGWRGAHRSGALGEELLTTKLSALTSEHGHLRGPGVVGGPRDPWRTICDAPLANVSWRACANMIGVALHVAERRGAERAPTSAARPPRRAEARHAHSVAPSERSCINPATTPSSPFGQSPNLGKTDAAKRRRVGAGRLPTHLDPKPPRTQRFPQRGLRAGWRGAHRSGALGEELLTTKLSALTSEHGHLRGPGVVGGPRDPWRTICDAPLANVSWRAPSSGTSKGRRATRRDGASSCPHRRRTRPRTSRRQPAAISSSYLARVTTRRCSVNDGHGRWPMCSRPMSRPARAAQVRCAGRRSPRRAPPPRAYSPSMASVRARRRSSTRSCACPNSWSWGSSTGE